MISLITINCISHLSWYPWSQWLYLPSISPPQCNHRIVSSYIAIIDITVIRSPSMSTNQLFLIIKNYPWIESLPHNYNSTVYTTSLVGRTNIRNFFLAGHGDTLHTLHKTKLEGDLKGDRKVRLKISGGRVYSEIKRPSGADIGGLDVPFAVRKPDGHRHGRSDVGRSPRGAESVVQRRWVGRSSTRNRDVRRTGAWCLLSSIRSKLCNMILSRCIVSMVVFAIVLGGWERASQWGEWRGRQGWAMIANIVCIQGFVRHDQFRRRQIHVYNYSF